MRSYSYVALLLLVACSPKDKAAPAADGAAPPVMSSNDFAGTWKMETRREGSDSVLLRFELVAGSGETGWELRFPGRDPVASRIVAMGGDSVVSEAGPYESMVRPGKQVTTRTTLHRSGDKLTGKTVATYASGPDSVIRLVTVGTR